MRVSTALGLLLLCAAACAADNPLATAKVGDWAEYKIVSKVGPLSSSSEERHEVVKVTPRDVTIEVTMKFGGQELQQGYVVKLADKFDPLVEALWTESYKSQESGSGEETLTVVAQPTKTRWTAYDVTITIGEQTAKAKAKVWFAPGIPLGGVVKTETDLGAQGKKTRQLTAYGSGK